MLDKSVVKVGRGVGVKGERAGKKEDVEDTDDDEWEVGWKRVSAKAKREVRVERERPAERIVQVNYTRD